MTQFDTSELDQPAEPKGALEEGTVYLVTSQIETLADFLFGMAASNSINEQDLSNLLEVVNKDAPHSGVITAFIVATVRTGWAYGLDTPTQTPEPASTEATE